MSALRVLRHGPLLFWLAAVAGLSFVVLYAVQVGDSPQTPSVAAARSDASAGAVDSFRAELSALPKVVAYGDVGVFATALAERAEQESARSTSSNLNELASGWDSVAAAARSLASVDVDDADALGAAVGSLTTASDRLVVIVGGGTPLGLDPHTGTSGPVDPQPGRDEDSASGDDQTGDGQTGDDVPGGGTPGAGLAG
jgi:hypothetical protein